MKASRGDAKARRKSSAWWATGLKWLATIVRILLSFVGLRREVFIWPVVAAVLLVTVLALVFIFTGFRSNADPNDLVAFAFRAGGVLFAVMIVGAMKTRWKDKSGYMLPDVDESDPKTPWQLVAVDAAATVVLIIGIAWLVVGR